jgi:hypothetical protein
MIRPAVLGSLVACAIAGCALAERDDQTFRSDELFLDETDLAVAVLELANGADAGALASIVASHAAASIVEARPFADLDQLAAARYVGDAALNALLRHAAPEAVDAGAGFWEETLLSSLQATTTLEMANALALTTLGCDLGLSRTIGQRIIDARPFDTVTALVDVPYVGAFHLRKFKAGVPWYLSADATSVRLDCVSFTSDQLAAGLRLVNEAGYGQLCALGSCGFAAWTGQVEALMSRRPWGSLEQVAGFPGIGPAAMGRIREGAQRVLDGLVLGPDSVRSVLSGQVHGEWVALGPTQVLEGNVAVGSVYVPGTGYRLSQCRRIADAGEPDPETFNALHCVATCSPQTRYWFHHVLGLVFYTGDRCSID